MVYGGCLSLWFESVEAVFFCEDPQTFFIIQACPLTAQQFVSPKKFYAVETKCQMAMLHHHKQDSKHNSGSQLMWLCFAAQVFTGFLMVLCPWATHKKTLCLFSGDLSRNIILTLVRPEPSWGGRDLEAAVTRALDVARFPVQRHRHLTVMRRDVWITFFLPETQFY